MKTYEKYKDSGVEWIGEIPEHWEVKRFGLIFSFYRGLPITKQDLKDEGIPCVSYGEIHSKYGFYVDPAKHDLKFVDDLYLKSSGNSLLNRGDFVFADTSEDIKGSGNFTCLNSDISIFAGYHTIIARQKTKHNYKYLAYYFDSIGFRNQIRREVSGIKVFSITQGILKSTSLLLPNFEDQVIIANYLDRKTAEIDRIIANKQKLIVLYEEEKQAVINQAVTKGLDPTVKLKDSGVEWLGEIPEHWEVKNLKYLARVQTGGTPKIQNAKMDYFAEGNINWYTPSDFYNDGVLEDSKRKINDFAVEDGEVEIFSEDSVFLVSIGATLGKVGLSKTKASANQQINVIIFDKSQINPFYGYYFLVSNKEMIKLEADYTTLPILNQTKTKSLTISCPDLKEQDKIVQYTDNECGRINTILEKFNKQIDLLQEYRTTLISEVVTGKVRITE